MPAPYIIARDGDTLAYAPDSRPRPPRQTVTLAEQENPDRILHQILARRGQRYTRERRKVLNVVLTAHGHLDGNSLYDLLHERGVRVSKATVYRTLRLLQEAGIIREVFHGAHGASSYEYVHAGAHHEHMICLSCGGIIEFGSKQLEDIQEAACHEHHFTPVRHQLQVFGYCQTCQRKGGTQISGFPRRA